MMLETLFKIMNWKVKTRIFPFSNLLQTPWFSKSVCITVNLRQIECLLTVLENGRMLSETISSFHKWRNNPSIVSGVRNWWMWKDNRFNPFKEVLDLTFDSNVLIPSEFFSGRSSELGKCPKYLVLSRKHDEVLMTYACHGRTCLELSDFLPFQKSSKMLIS